MLSQISRAIDESHITDIPEVEELRKSLTTIDRVLTSAKEAVSERVMKMVQDGDVEGLYKIRPLVDLISSEDPAKITVTMASDLSNKRPKSINFLGTEAKATSWRGVTEAVLNILYNSDKSGFTNLMKSTDFKSKAPYYAKSPENMKAPVMLGSGAGVVYADASRITNNDFFYLKKTLQVLGHEISDVVIELDPTFQRKPITNRAKKNSQNETKSQSQNKSQSKSQTKTQAKTQGKTQSKTQSKTKTENKNTSKNESPKNKKPTTKKTTAKSENKDTAKRRGRPKATNNTAKQTGKKTARTKTKAKTAVKESVSA